MKTYFCQTRLIVACIFCLMTLIMIGISLKKTLRYPLFKLHEHTQSSQESLNAARSQRNQWSHPTAEDKEFYLPALATRYEIPLLLEEFKFTTGLELGVQNGDFSGHILDNWPSCKKFYLVDVWQPVINYADVANVGEQYQNVAYNNARRAVNRHAGKTNFLRMTGTEANKAIEDGSLDFIYIDARHDYCAALSDLNEWWPKLRAGGLFAGHDYTSHEYVEMIHGGDWTLCENGQREPGAARRAVDEFARKHQVIVSVTYDTNTFTTASWMIRKPFE